MKRFLRSMSPVGAAVALLASLAWASHTIYNSTFINETGLAYNNTYVLDTQNMNLDSLTMHATYSTATFTTATFTDGTASTGTITVVSTAAIHGVQGTDTLTIVNGRGGALAAAFGTDTINVSSNSAQILNNAIVTVNGIPLTMGQDWFVGASSNSTATSIALAINASTPFTASVGLAGSTVTVTCPTVGTACNSYTLKTSTTIALAVATAKFTGGQNAATFSVNGSTLTNGQDWSNGFSSTNTASGIATAVSGVSGFTASASSNVVTISCVSSGTFCNAYTLWSSTNNALSVGSSKFTGGVDPVRLAINGIVLTEGVDFTATTSSDTAAVNIVAAINGNSSLSAIVVASTNTAGVVLTSATAVGTSTNYSIWTSSYNALKPSAPNMRIGTNSAVVTSLGQLNIAKHGYTTALPLLFTKTAGTPPQDLNIGTTYYVVVVDANDFKLATTSAKAQAGTADVRLSTQTAMGGGSFKLTPLVYSGTASFDWEASNDGVNYNPISVSSITYSSPSATLTSSQWDFGSFNGRYIRLNVIGPTQGGLKLTVTGVGKGSYK